MMSRNFSFKTFFRNVSTDLLKDYFEHQHVLADFDWSVAPEVLPDALYAQIEQLPDRSLAVIEQDFVTISDLADEEGVLGLIEVIQTLFTDADSILDEMMNYDSFESKVLWASLEYPDAYDWAIRLERVEGMTFKEDCLVGKHLPCSTDDETIEKLKERIQKFYKRQRRGRNCQIDCYVRRDPHRYCFFAYPEDYPKRDLTYQSSQLVPQIRRPVMEIVFIYEPDTGNLKIHASKLRKVDIMQKAFCKTVLGLPGIPDGSTRVYDLSPLMNPSFRFVTEPQDQVESVSLRMLKVRISNTENRKLTCEATPQHGGAELVQTMMNNAINACGSISAGIKVLSAKITLKFAALDGGRKKSVTFVLTAPSGSTLEDKPHHHVARKYLEKWGLVRTLLPLTEEAA